MWRPSLKKLKHLFYDQERNMSTALQELIATGTLAKPTEQHRFGIECRSRNMAEAYLLPDKLFLKSVMFPELSLDPLGLRNKQGLPRLATFPMDSASFILRATKRYSLRPMGRVVVMDKYTAVRPPLPNPIERQYDLAAVPLMGKISARINGDHNVTREIACEFDGAIPSLARKDIVLAKPFFENIFVIVEVQHWLEEQVVVVGRGPAVAAGWDGNREKGTLHLITVFDTGGSS